MFLKCMFVEVASFILKQKQKATKCSLETTGLKTIGFKEVSPVAEEVV